MKLKSKKGQIGETITWIVATVIIIVILIFSIFVASLLSKTKVLGKGFKSEDDGNRDLIGAKSLTAYLLTKNEKGNKMFDLLRVRDNLDGDTGPSAKKIFEELYEKVWIGINFKRNEYLGVVPVNYRDYQYSLEEIKLNDDKFVELLVLKEK